MRKRLHGKAGGGTGMTHCRDGFCRRFSHSSRQLVPRHQIAFRSHKPVFPTVYDIQLFRRRGGKSRPLTQSLEIIRGKRCARFYLIRLYGCPLMTEQVYLRALAVTPEIELSLMAKSSNET